MGHKKKAKRPELPRKMSALLRLAVKDAQAVEKSKKYVLNMGTWHSPSGNRCHVCLAGSVMAKSLGSSPDKELDPYDLPARTRDALLAVNDMREGDFAGAARTLRLKDDHRAIAAASALVDFDNGNDDMAQSWQHYLDAADVLERFGL